MQQVLYQRNRCCINTTPCTRKNRNVDNAAQSMGADCAGNAREGFKGITSFWERRLDGCEGRGIQCRCPARSLYAAPG